MVYSRGREVRGLLGFGFVWIWVGRGIVLSFYVFIY